MPHVILADSSDHDVIAKSLWLLYIIMGVLHVASAVLLLLPLFFIEGRADSTVNMTAEQEQQAFEMAVLG